MPYKFNPFSGTFDDVNLSTGAQGPTGATGATGATGPAGTSGVVAATAPITYDSGTQTVSTSIATNKLLGRSTAGSGVIEEITLGTNLSFTGTTLNAAGGGGSGTPGGSNTQIQFNDSSAFAGDADLTWNKTTNVLGITGDVNLSDGGSFTTTLQTITPTAARTISFPDATGTVGLVGGSSGNLVVNQSGAYAGVANSSVDNATGNITLGSRFISSLNGAASAPPGAFTGTWFTGGTGTTTKPQVLIEPTGTTSTAWSTSGTGFGVNAASGFAGRLLDLQLNGTSNFAVSPFNTGARLDFGPNAFIRGTTQSGQPYMEVYAQTGVGLRLRSDQGFIVEGVPLGLSLAGSGADVILARDAADSLAQRRATNAQTFRVYDTFTSATDYHRIAIATARATLTNVSGASVTATALIPAGAVVMGVTSKVTTALGTGNGTTGYKIGTTGDDDRWGAITGTATGTTSDNRDWTAGTIECFPAATDIIVTATGGNFNATGVIYLSVQYMTGQAD